MWLNFNILRMDIGDRFVIFLREKKINQKDFCKLTGYGQQSLSKLVQGKTPNPGVQLFVLVGQHFPELNLRWLIMGEGDIWREGFVSSGEKRDAIVLPASTVKIMGKGTNVEYMQKLLDAKDQLIKTQQDLIDELKSKS